LDTTKTFGDPQTFAIRYRPSEDGEVDKNDKFAFCHLIIDNKLIGNDDECCYLPTWVYYLTDEKNRIEQDTANLFADEFTSLTNREIFETCLKSTQLEEEEVDSEFRHLPKLHWQTSRRHQLILDETVDGYYLFLYVKDGKITFLIEDLLGLGYQTRRSYKFIFKTVSLNDAFNTINKAITSLTQTYPYLTESISTRTYNSR